MKTIYEWNNEYGKYHKNKTNKVIHWICIPLIMFSLFGLLSLLNFSYPINEKMFPVNVLVIFIVLVTLYYFKLSKKLAIGMALISIALVQLVDFINLNNPDFQLLIYLTIFITAWIGQFIGHKVEGKKPAFFKDLQFLLIGPLWLLSFIYKKINIKI